jgi:phage baseplate assembly protein W
MNFPHGSCLRHPVQPDRRGTLGTSSDRSGIIEQSIAAIVETRQGERVMAPDYGIPDFVFAVVDAGFAARLAYFIERQVKRYEPLVETIRVRAGSLVGDKFSAGFAGDEQRAAVSIEFTERGSNRPTNLVWPTWKLR